MGNIGRVRVVFNGIPAGPGMATHFYRLDAAWNWAGYDDNLRDGLESAYHELDDLIPDVMSFQVAPDIDILDEETGDLIATYSAAAQGGDFASANGFGPLATGFCTTWRTGGIVNSKHVRGRTFIVPVQWDVVDPIDGVPKEAAMGIVGQWATAVEGALGVFGNLVVWSRPVRNSEGEITRAGSAHEVSSHTTATQFAVLRSRRD